MDCSPVIALRLAVILLFIADIPVIVRSTRFGNSPIRIPAIVGTTDYKSAVITTTTTNILTTNSIVVIVIAAAIPHYSLSLTVPVSLDYNSSHYSSAYLSTAITTPTMN